MAGDGPRGRLVDAVALHRHDATRIATDRSSPCNAPFANMYFSAAGWVAPCWIQIGRGHDRWRPDRSILDIWSGPTFAGLRQALIEGIFPGACGRCADDVEAGNVPLASVYDAAEPLTGRPQSLELELSNRCNLECVMCHGELSSRIRQHREGRPPLDVPYDEHFLGHLAEVLPGLHRLRFSGGEPMLHDLVHQAASLVTEQRPDLRIDISTNGTIATPRVWRLLEGSYVQLNVSFDSLDERRYEAIRVGSSFSTLMDNLSAFGRHFERHAGLLTVNVNPMRMNWQEMPDFVRWCDERALYLTFNEVVEPAGLALRTLPAAELRDVHAELSRVEKSARSESSDPHRRHNHEQFVQLVRRIGTWAAAADADSGAAPTSVPVATPRRRTAAEPVDRTPRTHRAADDSSLACRAPFTSLFLDQHGTVRPCCKSTLELGSVTKERLVDIWNGEKTVQLREAMTRGDLSLGCHECASHVGAGERELAFARRFDDLPLDHPAGPVQLELALSNACNLECIMCYGDCSSTIRTKREHRPPLPKVYGDEFFDELEDVLPGLRQVEFFGGEPFLGRETGHLMDRLARLERPPAVRVTTNGTVWNERVREIVRRLRISLVVSVDGATPETFERVRRGARWSEVRANLDDMRELTRETGASLSLAYCLMPQNWRDFPAVLRLGESLEASVWVNTVTLPRFASPFHLDRQDLETIVDGLEAHESSLADLAEPWRTTWAVEVRRLRDLLPNASRPAAVVDPARLTAPPDRVVVCQLDVNAVPFDVEVVRDDPCLPPFGLDELIARAVASPDSLGRVGIGGRLIERRTLTRDVYGPGLEITTVTVEHWLEQRDEATLRAELAQQSWTGAVVEIDLDDWSVVTGLRCGPEPLERLGLELGIGDTCRSPLDALSPRLRGNHPTVEEVPVDAGTRRIVVRCDSGYELVAFARMASGTGGLRILATATTGPEGIRSDGDA